jgi:hypothetical protein
MSYYYVICDDRCGVKQRLAVLALSGLLRGGSWIAAAGEL